MLDDDECGVIGGMIDREHRSSRKNPVLVRVKVKVMSQPTDSRPVYLSVRHPSGAYDQCLFWSESFGFVDTWRPSDKRTDSSLQLLRGLASAVTLGFYSRGAPTIFYCLRFETHPHLEGQVPVFISPKNRVFQYKSQGTGFIIRHLLTVRRASMEIIEPPPQEYCPTAILFTRNPTHLTRARTRAAAVGSHIYIYMTKPYEIKLILQLLNIHNLSRRM
jgi:hypothetical protein